MQTVIKKPWYRERWIWLLFTPPAVAIVAGMITLYLAISSNDGLVVDDYYQHGKAINQVLQRDQAAAKRGLAGGVVLDNGEIVLTLRADDAAALPPAVQLTLLHATRKDFDRQFLLPRGADGDYRAPLPALVQGRWHVQAEAGDWRLLGSLRIPQEDQARLEPGI